MESQSKSVMIRRFVAIGLMALTILFLFWPSVIIVNGESDAWESLAKDMRYGRSDYGDQFAREYKRRTERYSSYSVSEAELKEARNVGKECYDFIMDDGYNASFFRLRSFIPNLMKFSLDADEKPVAIVMSVLMNFLFFAILLFALASIPMMLFNKSKVFNILHLVFVLLTSSIFLVFGFMGIVMENIPDANVHISPLYPGVSTFLLPMFSLAALIVYRRPKPEKKAAAPAYTPYPQQPAYPQQPMNGYQQPVYPQQPMNQYQQPAYPQQPADDPWNRQPANDPWSRQPTNDPWNQQPSQPAQEALWTCPICGTKNPTSSLFCHNCGTKQP